MPESNRRTRPQKPKSRGISLAKFGIFLGLTGGLPGAFALMLWSRDWVSRASERQLLTISLVLLMLVAVILLLQVALPWVMGSDDTENDSNLGG